VGVTSVGEMRIELPDWTVEDGLAFQTADGPTGNFAALNRSTAIRSQSYTLGPNAQSLNLDLKFLDSPSGGNSFKVFVIPDGGQEVQVFSRICYCATGWEHHSIDLTDWAGQNIQIKATTHVASGRIAVDNLGVVNVDLPEWTVLKGLSRVDSGGPSDKYAVLYGSAGNEIISSPFTLSLEATKVRLSTKFLSFGSSGNILRVWVLSGPSFQTQTEVASRICYCVTEWEKLWANVASWAGQTIKLRITRDVTSSGSFGIDNVATNLLEPNLGLDPESEDTEDPINTSNGNFYHQHTDVAIPAKGQVLGFSRSYNSASTYSGDVGYGWVHNYAFSAEVQTDNSVIVRFPDGSTAHFAESGGSYVAPPGVFSTLVQNGDGSFTLTTVSALEYNFSAAGELTSIVDRNGNATTVSYDTNGFLSAVEDASGRSLTFTTDASGRITEVADPLGRTVQFEYDGAGDLVEVTDVKGGTTTYAYSNHRMTSLADSNGHLQVTNVYDNANRVVEQADALGGVTCVYYGSGPTFTSTNCPGVTPTQQAGQTVVVDQRGKKTTYDFDTSFRTTSVTDHDGGVTSFGYDSDSNRTCVTDPLGHKTGFTYDSNGNVTGVIDAENTDASCELAQGGVQWTYTYTPLNDIDLETDALGRQVDYAYDTDGNLTQAIRKDSGGTTKQRACFTVPASGPNKGLATEVIESSTLSDCTGNVTKLEYDSYGNQAAVIDPRFSGQQTPPKTTMTYDLGGRRLMVTNELGHATTLTYDNQNNVLTVEDELLNVTTYTYDAKGNLLTITDANDKVTTYDYDDADRLVSVLDAAGKTTSYGYDAVGNRTSVMNANP